MFEIKMPKMGESVEQATITKWFVSVGDKVEEDDNLLEIATDKVDSEIPSPVAGTVVSILFKENDVVPVGKVIATINTNGETSKIVAPVAQSKKDNNSGKEVKNTSPVKDIVFKEKESYNRFYSPLVKIIAQKENISPDELNSIKGSGKEGRVRKVDLLEYLKNKTQSGSLLSINDNAAPKKANPSIRIGDEIIEMDRMRRLIADHMIKSTQVSAHVTNMVEADVTAIVKWRTMMKEIYQTKYKAKLTYMPIFTEAVAKALRDFPMVNSSVDGNNIIVKGHVNIGIAVSKPDGNLIVPVIKDADRLNIPGLASTISQLADKARGNKLSPDDIQEGTFSITNFGSFRNLMGTPIISQPQVAILATGSIEKKPAVVETEHGDIIVPRHKMFLSLSYDHRIIDGALGGAFLRRVADYLEQFDANREV